MAEKKLQKVHRDFRIVALAEPPNSTGTVKHFQLSLNHKIYSKRYYSGKTSSHWLSPEVLSMFFYHTLRPMNAAEEISVLESLIGDKLAIAMNPIIKLAQHLRKSNDPTLNSLESSLSTRQLLRIAKRLKVRVIKKLKNKQYSENYTFFEGIPK
jgi:hypothetical protein